MSLWINVWIFVLLLQCNVSAPNSSAGISSHQINSAIIQQKPAGNEPQDAADDTICGGVVPIYPNCPNHRLQSPSYNAYNSNNTGEYCEWKLDLVGQWTVINVTNWTITFWTISRPPNLTESTLNVNGQIVSDLGSGPQLWRSTNPCPAVTIRSGVAFNATIATEAPGDPNRSTTSCPTTALSTTTSPAIHHRKTTISSNSSSHQSTISEDDGQPPWSMISVIIGSVILLLLLIILILLSFIVRGFVCSRRSQTVPGGLQNKSIPNSKGGVHWPTNNNKNAYVDDEEINLNARQSISTGVVQNNRKLIISSPIPLDMSKQQHDCGHMSSFESKRETVYDEPVATGDRTTTVSAIAYYSPSTACGLPSLTADANNIRSNPQIINENRESSNLVQHQLPPVPEKPPIPTKPTTLRQTFMSSYSGYMVPNNGSDEPEYDDVQ